MVANFISRSLQNFGTRLGLKANFLKNPYGLTDEEREFLSILFVPQYYSALAGLPADCSRQALFNHFLMTGMATGLSPTPLFEPQIFREREGVPDPALRGLPDILRWCRTRYQTGIIPTTRFDPVYYLDTYDELAKAGVDLFEHFLRHGLTENRRPNGVFDPSFYALVRPRIAGSEALSDYIHYLAIGIDHGAAPSATLAPILARTAADRAGGLAAYDQAVAVITPWIHAIGTDACRLLLGLFHPYLYDGNGALPDHATGIQRLAHFLEEGIEAGLSPGPFFDASIYQSHVETGRKKRKAAPRNPLLEFIDKGATAGITPTILFDEKTYRASWADMQDETIWPFDHFLAAGIFEGRRIDGSEREGVWTLPLDSTAGQIQNWQLFWTEAGFPAPAEVAPAPPREVPSNSPQSAEIHAPDLSGRDLSLIRALFVPAWYARQAGLNADAPVDDLLGHYLTNGINENLSPGPLFDPVRAAELCGADASAPAMKVWLARRRSNWAAPTSLFDPDFYRRFYPEFKGVDLDLYEHFVVHGLREMRLPNSLMEPAWYDQAYHRPAEEAALPAYAHFLVYGADRGLSPSRVLLPVFGFTGASRQSSLEDFVRLEAAIRPILKDLSPDRVQALLALFVPHSYDGAGTLGRDASGIDRLVHFLKDGMINGLAPGPFFDAEYYTEARVGRRILASRKEAPFLHYLRNGWPKRFVPNQIFDEDAYRLAQPDIKEQNVWGFRHFIFHGIYEGRKIGTSPGLTIWPRANDFAGSQLSNWRMFWAGPGGMVDGVGLAGAIARQQKRLLDFVTSSLFDEIVRRAQAIEPALGEPRKISAIYAAPHHDQLADVMDRIRARIPDRSYETVITVPWLRTGGADLVACQLAAAVKETQPEGNILILRVDQKHLERPDWIPDGVDHVHISDLLGFVSSDNAESLLYALLLGLAPKRVINVNSYRVWRTFERFSRRLSERISLYSYLFCWDQTADGLRVGYPSMFYAATSPNLAGTLTDTDYLRRELLRLYSPPDDVAQRTIAVYTPARTEPTKHLCAELGVERRIGKRPLILWAGRLDRQKRFDLVQEIARRMPHADFHCWGDALLDSPPDFNKSPRNLKLNPGFKDYAELPFEDADLWLFTSAWEGMPTILIEIAVRGMAVVASQVGGVPELANDETSFAVHDIDDVEAYVKQVQFALDNPKLRIERARKLQQRAIERYTRPSYVNQLKRIFDREG